MRRLIPPPKALDCSDGVWMALDEVIEQRPFLLRCTSPLLAQSRHELVHLQCPLSGVKRT
jgi:hypothetical protein